MVDMLRTHILVNSIADYYHVDELKKQANDNISRILKHFWYSDGIMAAVELVYESTLGTELYRIMVTAVTDHLTELVVRDDFFQQKLNNQFSLLLIYELCKKSTLNENKVKLMEQEIVDMRLAAEDELLSCK